MRTAVGDSPQPASASAQAAVHNTNCEVFGRPMATSITPRTPRSTPITGADAAPRGLPGGALSVERERRAGAALEDLAAQLLEARLERTIDRALALAWIVHRDPGAGQLG